MCVLVLGVDCARRKKSGLKTFGTSPSTGRQRRNIAARFYRHCRRASTKTDEPYFTEIGKKVHKVHLYRCDDLQSHIPDLILVRNVYSTDLTIKGIIVQAIG